MLPWSLAAEWGPAIGDHGSKKFHFCMWINAEMATDERTFDPELWHCLQEDKNENFASIDPKENEKMAATVKAGVVTGEEYKVLVSAAKSGGYALPAVNVVGTNSVNAV